MFNPDHDKAPLEHGRKFGDLTVLRRADSKRKRGPRYRCGCTCGRQVVVTGAKLTKGEQTNCGGPKHGG